MHMTIIPRASMEGTVPALSGITIQSSTGSSSGSLPQQLRQRLAGFNNRQNAASTASLSQQHMASPQRPQAVADGSRRTTTGAPTPLRLSGTQTSDAPSANQDSYLRQGGVPTERQPEIVSGYIRWVACLRGIVNHTVANTRCCFCKIVTPCKPSKPRRTLRRSRMRLLKLDEETGLPVAFVEVAEPSTKLYAALSHVWDKLPREAGDDSVATEQTYQDLVSILPATAENMHRLSEKLRGFCKKAHAHGYRLVWADMCCIDKTSSAEVTEAITSMYYWYFRAAACYAYLKDVVISELPQGQQALLHAKLSESEWFRRGWTLQELIAPRVVLFFSKEWKPLGTKAHLAQAISSRTRIPPDVLSHKTSVSDVSVASRMSWAAHRETTKPEDKAYCLLGLFGVRMPVLYGEGGNAFYRLQAEIADQVADPSIFAWGHYARWAESGFKQWPGKKELLPDHKHLEVHVRHFPALPDFGSLFAASPDSFDRTSDPAASSPPSQFPARVDGPISIANQRTLMRGAGPFLLRRNAFHILQMSIALIPLAPHTSGDGSHGASGPNYYLAPLGCETHEHEPLALLLTLREPNTQGHDTWHIGSGRTHRTNAQLPDPPHGRPYFRLIALPQPSLPPLMNVAIKAKVFFPMGAPGSHWYTGDPHDVQDAEQKIRQIAPNSSIHLAGWCSALLRAAGYNLEWHQATPPGLLHTIYLNAPDGYTLQVDRPNVAVASTPRLEITFPSSSESNDSGRNQDSVNLGPVGTWLMHNGTAQRTQTFFLSRTDHDSTRQREQRIVVTLVPLATASREPDDTASSPQNSSFYIEVDIYPHLDRIPAGQSGSPANPNSLCSGIGSVSRRMCGIVLAGFVSLVAAVGTPLLVIYMRKRA